MKMKRLEGTYNMHTIRKRRESSSNNKLNCREEKKKIFNDKRLFLHYSKEKRRNLEKQHMFWYFIVFNFL